MCMTHSMVYKTAIMVISGFLIEIAQQKNYFTILSDIYFISNNCNSYLIS